MRFNPGAVRRFRLAKRWTRQRLAKEAGIEPQTIGYIERGASSPTARTITKIAVALEVEPNDLFVINGGRR